MKTPLRILLVSLVFGAIIAGPTFLNPLPAPTVVEAQGGNVVESFVDNAVACDQTSANTVFTTGGVQMAASMVTISNDGSNEVFVRFDNTTATTANAVRINAGGTFTMVSRDRWSRSLTCICSTGETTTLRVAAYR